MGEDASKSEIMIIDPSWRQRVKNAVKNWPEEPVRDHVTELIEIVEFAIKMSNDPALGAGLESGFTPGEYEQFQKLVSQIMERLDLVASAAAEMLKLKPPEYNDALGASEPYPWLSLVSHFDVGLGSVLARSELAPSKEAVENAIAVLAGLPKPPKKGRPERRVRDATRQIVRAVIYFRHKQNLGLKTWWERRTLQPNEQPPDDWPPGKKNSLVPRSKTDELVHEVIKAIGKPTDPSRLKTDIKNYFDETVNIKIEPSLQDLFFPTVY